jgi:DNA-binding MarR family transcriptional regulator
VFILKYSRGQKVKILNLLSEKEVNSHVSQIVPNLTPQQTMVLMALLEDPNHRIIQKDFENWLKISHATIRGVIKRLSTMGFVKTEAVISDHRQIEVSLTDMGLKMMSSKYNQISLALDQSESKVAQKISEDDLRVFDRVLDQMIKNLE